MHDVLAVPLKRLDSLNSSFLYNTPHYLYKYHLAVLLLPCGNWSSRKKHNNGTLANAIIVSNAYFLSLTKDKTRSLLSSVRIY